MSTSIGFDRPLQLDWLDLIASRIGQSGDPGAAMTETREVVAAAVGGGDSPHNATGKTMTVLARIWVKVPDDLVATRDEVAAALPRMGPSDRMAVHWAMCELAYPFYLDAAGIVGRMLMLQDHVTLNATRARLTERWGARGTMPSAAQRLLRMWSKWGVLQAIDARGTYAAGTRHPVDPRATRYVASLRVRAEATRALDLDDLQQSADLFPFELSDLRTALEAATDVQVTREGGRRSVIRPTR